MNGGTIARAILDANTGRDAPAEQKKPCYHRWLVAPDSGTVAHMTRRCWKTRSGANKIPLGYSSHIVMVLKCQAGCPCQSFRLGCEAQL